MLTVKEGGRKSSCKARMGTLTVRKALAYVKENDLGKYMHKDIVWQV